MINKDIVEAVKKADREKEIELYTKPINHSNVYKSKNNYTRKDKHKKSLVE